MSINPLHSNEKLFTRQLNASEYIGISNLLTIETFPKDHVFSANDTRLYRLQRIGKINQIIVDKAATDKEKKTANAIKPNEWFNYKAFFTGDAGRERFKCEANSVCWCLDRQKLIEFLRTTPDLAAAMPHNNDTVQILAAAGGLRSDDNTMPDLRKALFDDTLSDDDFLKVATIIKTGKANRGEVLIEQGGNHTRVYYLRNGRLRARQITAKGADVRRGDIWTGMRVNATSFIIEATNKDTLEVIDTTKFWYIERDDFQKLIKKHPQISAAFRPTNESKTFAEYRKKYPWLKNGELVKKDANRHSWFFWRRVLPSIPIFLIAFLVALVFFNEPMGWLLFLIFAGLPMACWVWWNHVDWKNDYFVITDQRVVQREKVVGIFDRFDEIPVDRVDNITTSVPDWVQKNITGTGYIKVEAQGVGSQVEFNMVADPDGLKNTIFETRDFVRARKKAFEAKHLREFLTKTIEGFSQTDPPPEKKKDDTPPKTPFQKWRQGVMDSWKAYFKSWFAWQKFFTFAHWKGRWAALAAYFKISDKFEDGSSIVYRRSILMLYTEIFVPSVVILLYLGIFGLFMWAEMSTGWQTPFLAYCMPFTFFGVILLVWFLYNFEDWRNDTYVLKPDALIDNYRTPFGLRGSKTVQTGYEKITNTEARTNGVWGWFDIGDVVLKTGADGEIVLKGIMSPRRVIQEITRRRDKLEESKVAKQAVDRQREIGEALRIYDEYLRTHNRGTLYAGEAGRADE